MALGMLSCTLPNVWVRWVSLSWISWVSWVSLLSLSDHVKFHFTCISEVVKFLLWLLACWVSLSWMSEYAEFYSSESLRSPSFSHDSWHAEFHSPDSPVTQSFTLRNLWVRCVSLLSRSDHVKFPKSPESLKSPSFSRDSWHAEFQSPECMSTLSSTILNLSEFAKSPSWLLACLISLSWMSEYAEVHFPESLRSPSFSHDSWHAEFHSPDSLVMQSFTLQNLWVRCVSLLSRSDHVK